MFLSKSKFWYSNNCLHFVKCAVPLVYLVQTSAACLANWGGESIVTYGCGVDVDLLDIFNDF